MHVCKMDVRATQMRQDFDFYGLVHITLCCLLYPSKFQSGQATRHAVTPKNPKPPMGNATIPYCARRHGDGILQTGKDLFGSMGTADKRVFIQNIFVACLSLRVVRPELQIVRQRHGTPH